MTMTATVPEAIDRYEARVRRSRARYVVRVLGVYGVSFSDLSPEDKAQLIDACDVAAYPIEVFDLLVRSHIPIR